MPFANNQLKLIIMIQIKKNEYVQPTEVREEVVQAICDAFVYGAENPTHVHTTYHPFNSGAYRKSTKFVAKPTRNGVVNVFGFKDSYDCDKTDIKYQFNGAEMKRAFEELINAGYYIFKVWYYDGTWMGYKCYNKPYAPNWWRGAVKVTSFDDFID